jgi:hypothetical protein
LRTVQTNAEWTPVAQAFQPVRSRPSTNGEQSNECRVDVRSTGSPACQEKTNQRMRRGHSFIRGQAFVDGSPFNTITAGNDVFAEKCAIPCSMCPRKSGVRMLLCDKHSQRMSLQAKRMSRLPRAERRESSLPAGKGDCFAAWAARHDIIATEPVNVKNRQHHRVFVWRAITFECTPVRFAYLAFAPDSCIISIRHGQLSQVCISEEMQLCFSRCSLSLCSRFIRLNKDAYANNFFDPRGL